jgi:hypothetical protein
VRYTVTLTPEPAALFVDPDRLTLERDDYLRIGALSASLTVSGTLEPGDDDHVRATLMSATGTLNVAVTIDGAPAPDGTFRIGATARPGGTSVDLADPAVLGRPVSASPAPGAGTAPVTVTFWRTARGGTDASGR